MKECTLGLFYLVKYAELIFLIVWTGITVSSATWFIDRITSQYEMEDKDMQCVIFVSISAVLIIFNTLYNNLLTNMRFLSKMKCVTCGICCYDVLNFAMCHCILSKPCRDRCCTGWTLGKWAVKGALIGYTIFLVTDKIQRVEDSFEVGSLGSDPGTTRLDIYLLIYILQHPIFVIARIPIFILYTILTCCCDKGNELGEENDFRDRILSFDFIPYELGVLNNFQNHPVGRNEFEYNRGLSIVRQ